MNTQNEVFIKASHTDVREQLKEMANYCGFAMKPLGLFNVFFQMLNVIKPSNMNRSRARDIVDTYIALCNEFYVIYSYSDEPKDEFYMTQKRWDEYGLGQKARENSIKFLEEYGFIHCRKMQNPYKPINTVRVYSIDDAGIRSLRLSVENLYADSRIKNYKNRRNPKY